jgi:hypothetical protein
MKLRLIAVLAVLLMAAAAVAQPRPGARVLADYLQLTPDQVAAWKQIHADTAAAIQPLRAQVQELRKQIAATNDPAQIGQLTVSLRSLRDQMKAAHEASKAKLVTMLTPEQKTKLDAFKAAMKFGAARRRPGR